jgi:hypothetical protein
MCVQFIENTCMRLDSSFLACCLQAEGSPPVRTQVEGKVIKLLVKYMYIHGLGCPTTDVGMPFLCAGTCEPSPLHWDTLCVDARRHILAKLTLRQLASVAPTCREFQQEFCHFSAKERGRLISVAEETFGKVPFSGFVRVFQRRMRDRATFPNVLPYCRNRLVIDAHGEIVVLAQEEVRRRFVSDECLLTISKFHHNYPIFGSLYQKGSRSGKGANIELHVSGPSDAAQFEVHVNREAAGVAVGVILSIFTGNAEAMPMHWHYALHSVILRIEDPRGNAPRWLRPLYPLCGAAEKKEAEDLVAPLRLLAASVKWYMPGEDLPRSYPAKEMLKKHPLPQIGTYPLAHLRLEWHAWWS